MKTTRQFTKTLKVDKVIDAAGNGDYTSIFTAVDTEPAGTSFFIRDGVYIETSDIVIKDNMTLTGESAYGVIIDFNGGDLRMQTNPTVADDMVDQEIGTDLVITEDSSVVTSASATFVTEGITAGMHIVFNGFAWEIASVDGETQLTLVEEYEGWSDTGIGYCAGSFSKNITLRNFTLTGSVTSDGCLMVMHSVHSTVEGMILRGNNHGIFGAAINARNIGSCILNVLQISNSIGRGLYLESSLTDVDWGTSVYVVAVATTSNVGIHINNASGMTLRVDSITSCGAQGVIVEGTRSNIDIGSISHCDGTGLSISLDTNQSTITVDSIHQCSVGVSITATAGPDSSVYIGSISECNTFGLTFTNSTSGNNVTVGSIRDVTTTGVNFSASSTGNRLVIKGIVTGSIDGVRFASAGNTLNLLGEITGNTNDIRYLDANADNNIVRGGVVGSIVYQVAGAVNNHHCNVTYTTLTILNYANHYDSCRNLHQLSYNDTLASPATIGLNAMQKTTELDASSNDVGVVLREDSGLSQEIPIGSRVTFKKSGANDTVIQAYSGATISDSATSAYTSGTITKGNAGQIYNETASETWATLTLEYVATDTWVIISAVGTWVTT